MSGWLAPSPRSAPAPTAGAHLARIHDIAEAAEYLTVHEALSGDGPLDHGLRVDDALSA